MTQEQLLILLLIAHVLTDFSFQTAKLASGKKEGVWYNQQLLVHVCILFLLTYALSLHASFLFGALLLTFAHYLIDLVKPRIGQMNGIGRWAFFIDQGLHVISIIGVVYLFGPYDGVNTFVPVPDVYQLRLILGFLICGRVVYFFINELFKSLEVSIQPKEIDHRRKRSWLGTLERSLILFFLVSDLPVFVIAIIGGMLFLRFMLYRKRKKAFILLEAFLSVSITFMIYYFIIEI